MIRRILRAAIPGALLVGMAACNPDKLNIPSYNAPDVGGVGADPSGIQLLATGLLSQERALAPFTADQFGRFGRESYDFFPTDARNVSNYLTGIPRASGTDPLTPGYTRRIDPAGFASGLYLDRFRNMRNAVNLREALTRSSLTQQQKDAGAGYAKTIYALDLLYIIESRDTLGTPVEITADANAQPPFVGRDAAYARIFAVLDSAETLLAAGGTTFPFTLHAGFAGRGFGTVAGFRQFNRAVKARALVQYAGIKRFHGTADSPTDVTASTARYTDAIAALGASYLAPIGSVADLDLGPQNLFSSTAGDVANRLSSAQNVNIIAHGSLATDTASSVLGSSTSGPGSIVGPNGAPATPQKGFVQPKTPGGALDDRSTSKVVLLDAPRSAPSNFGIPGYYRFQIYASPSSPGHILRNEELWLLRAEARWFAGNKPGAIADLTTVRSVSGGQTTPVNANGAPLTAASSDADFITALLYEKTMSLMLEGRRWVDYRRFNRLGSLPRDLVSGPNAHFYARVMPIPKGECDARLGTPNFPKQCSEP